MGPLNAALDVRRIITLQFYVKITPGVLSVLSHTVTLNVEMLQNALIVLGIMISTTPILTFFTQFLHIPVHLLKDLSNNNKKKYTTAIHFNKHLA